METITHSEFVNGYKSGLFTVSLNKKEAATFVLSKLGNKFNKFAFLVCASVGWLLIFPMTLALLFFSWIYSIVSILVGILLASATYKSVPQFVLDNILEDEIFFKFVLSNKGLIVFDKNGNECKFG